MGTITRVHFLVILVTTAFAQPMIHKKVVNLYSSEDQVQVLTADNFHDKVDNSSTAWFIKFYLSWCGHCQRLSLVWKDLAKDIYPWKDLVQVGAMDCAEESNIAICRSQNVTRYPIMKYYSTSHTNMEVEVPETEENVNSIRHYLLDRIAAEIAEEQSIYPNLLPFQGSDPGELFKGTSKETKYVFLVVEKLGGYLGVEVTMDLHRTPNVVIAHAYTNNTKLMQKLPTQQHPSVMVLYYTNLDLLPGSTSSRQELKDTIVKYLQSKKMAVVEDNIDETPHRTEAEKSTPSEEVLRHHVKLMGDVVFQKDLESALRYSLKQEVAISATIHGDKLQTLFVYLDVLKKYFPFGHKASPFLAELANLTSAQAVEGRQIGDIVKKAEDGGTFSSGPGFLGCRGSTPKFRGYTCSLWKLFHFLTVNCDNEQRPGEVLEAMVGYIAHFFGCKECSKHFQEMAMRRNLTQVWSLDGAILWLWRAHNEVNGRLKGSGAEDPETPKVQFPTAEACPGCVNRDSSWNEEEVLRFLKRMYGRYNVRYLGSDTRVLFEALQ